MKATIRKTGILFLAVAALASCSKDNDLDPDGGGNGDLLLVTEFKNDAGYPVKAEVYDRATEELVETHEYTYKKAN